MKKYILSMTMILLGIVLFSSCEKDETKVILNSDATAGELTAPATGDMYVLSSSDSANYLVFKWDAPNYGFDAAITYTVQMDEADNDFADIISLITGASLTTDSIMIYDLNSSLQDYAGDTVNFDVRIRSILSGENSSPYADTLYSDPITISISPYSAEISYASIYVPGSYQSWTPSTANQLYSLDDNGIYSGYVYLPDDSNEFKFTLDDTWDDNYGDTGADGTLDSGGDNIVVEGEGYYLMSVNMNSLTYTITETEWGIIGAFTNWGETDDIPLTYDSSTGLLTAEDVSITAGDIKFRANSSWDLNYGDTDADGTLDSGGDNITIESDGTYTVSLDLNGPIYTYTITAN